MKKKVFMNYWGSEVRVYEKAVRINPYIRVKFEKDGETIKQNLTAMSQCISDCIVADYEMYQYVKDYYERVHFIPQAIDLKKYGLSQDKEAGSRPVVVHAPTDTGIKGSSDIIRVMEDLRRHYDLDFILVQNKSHEEAKKIYQTADIIIDSILEGAYGLFALEAMAMGKPVVAWVCDYMREKYPKDLPIVSANPETLGREMENLLRDGELREEIGSRGRRYVEKYHDAGLVARQLLSLYQSC
jgi:glycosyltransferase involved in cell wall biosynthesis